MQWNVWRAGYISEYGTTLLSMHNTVGHGTQQPSLDVPGVLEPDISIGRKWWKWENARNSLHADATMQSQLLREFSPDYYR